MANDREPAGRRRSLARSGLDGLWRNAFRVAFQLRLVWWRVRRPTLTGAYVAVWHEGRLLCVRNSYRRRLTLPAGGLARGESPRAAAARELHEEVAIAVSPERLSYVGEIVSRVGGVTDRAHFFELHCDGGEPAYQVDEREVVWAAFLSPRELREVRTVDVVRQYLERVGARPPAAR